jgi:hypothetical protein
MYFNSVKVKFFFMIMTVVFLGCNNPSQDITVQPRVRAAIKPGGTGMVKVTVYVE